jgi:putative oxidoreductase
MAIFEGLSKYKDVGLLILRVGIGAFLMTHGVPKLMGGPAGWEGLGGSMGMFGIHFLPTFWGFMAAAAEGVGGLLLILGLFFRPATLLILFTMFVAAYSHFSKGDPLSKAELSIVFGIVALSLFIIGPGRYSIDKK